MTRTVSCKIVTSGKFIQHGIRVQAGTMSFNGIDDISVEELGEVIRHLNHIYQDLLMMRQQLEYELTFEVTGKTKNGR